MTWHQGDFHAQWEGERRFDAVVSCGPLNHFVRWFVQGPLSVRKLVAFSSTSAEVKLESDAADERALAEQLASSESILLDYCSHRGVAATVLRPTLIWGGGRDLNVSRIAQLGARRRFFVVPKMAKGLRQPVHVADLAGAVATVLASNDTAGKRYDLPGGQALTYVDMVRRIRQAVPGRTLMLQVPDALFLMAVHIMQKAGRLPGLTTPVLARMQQDLVFDDASARADLGWSPRGFSPSPAELGLDQ